MTEKRAFYYNFGCGYIWLALNVFFITMLGNCVLHYPFLSFWPQTKILFGTLVFSFVAWGYKYLVKHRLALVDDESIAIDFCQPLRWKDIVAAEERIVRCCGRKRRILVLIPKKNLKYHYNFLQKHNGDFTPFSIPLYGVLRPENEKELLKFIASKVKKISYLK